MAFAVPFGQFVPGDSVIHRLDARIKLLVVVAYVFALFATSGWLGLLLCAVLLLVGYGIARVPLRLAARGLKPVLVILLFTLVANTFTFNVTSPAIGSLGTGLGAGIFGNPLAQSLPDGIVLFGNFGIKPLGLLRGLYFVLRIVLLVSMTSLLTFTSSVITLTDAISSLLRPLRVLRVPVEDIATIFTIALRFIPLTAEEAEKIMVAQTARGAVFNSGGPIRRIKAWVPVIIPLFVNLFRRADDLACAMESRCYIGEGRTHLKVARLNGTEVFTGSALVLFLIVVGLVL